jgi:hypothetical protein
MHEDKPCILYSIIHVILIVCFGILIIYTVMSVANDGDEVFSICSRDLWKLLFIHTIILICITILLCILCVSMPPILLNYTHKNPFWLFLFPLLFCIAYSAIMTSLGIQYVIDTQNKVCYATLTEKPLLIILTWVFIVIDSIALLVELSCLFFMLCIQGFDKSIKSQDTVSC